MKHPFHFIGIGGIGMSGLAKILIEKNNVVSGSDLSMNERIESLSLSGVKVALGHTSDNIPQGASVVYTSMVDEVNPELKFAKENGFKLLHRSELLNLLMQGYQSLLVTGTHGKTTTSALLSWVLESSGLDPSYAVGGLLANKNSNAKSGKGLYFVAEADESDGSFLKYENCFGAIITNIDLDHMDFYKEETSLLQAFNSFADKVKSKEHLFLCNEDERLKSLNLEGVTYGFNETAELRGSHFRQEGWKVFFDVSFGSKTYKEVQLPLIGYHNALNALAVFGLAISLNIPEDKIREAFQTFRGVGRRAEKIGEASGILFIDDYAHHPTEIAATIKAIAAQFPWHRLVVLFQPHRFSRTKLCLGTFKDIFKLADLLLITDIYGACETPIPGLTAETVLEEIKAACPNLHSKYVKREALLDTTLNEIRPLDIVVTFGAGDITQLGKQLVAKLTAKPLSPLKLGLIFGGKSYEHDVSILSARNIDRAIDSHLYSKETFFISKQGVWAVGQMTKKILENDDSALEMKATDQSSSLKEASIPLEVLDKLQSCDILFPILHGPFGEDGTIQGFFEMINIPYAGCSHQPSAICMDKAVLKKLAAYHNLPIVPFVDFSFDVWCYEKATLLKEIQGKLHYPLFVKPVHLGSTIGISRVMNEEALVESIEKAFQVDYHVIVEQGLDCREIEFAVFGLGRVEALPPGEILSQGKVYDYLGKYGQNAVRAEPEATLPLHLVEEGRALAKKAYEIAGCDGYARVDFFLDHKQQYYLNEVNPLPGFTKNSLFPLICERWHRDLPSLINTLVAIGLCKKRRRQ